MNVCMYVCMYVCICMYYWIARGLRKSVFKMMASFTGPCLLGSDCWPILLALITINNQQMLY